MGALDVTMIGQDVIDAFLEVAAGMREAISEQLAVVSGLTKLTMMDNAPVGVGGISGLRGSIGFTLDPANLTSEIKPTAPYADAVETGSKPHWAPHGPGSSLAAWAKLKGINVYALAWSIARKGTKAHPFIVPTYNQVQDAMGDVFASGLDGYIRGIMA